MQRFTELMVWQRSHELTLEMYRLTSRFPAEERWNHLTTEACDTVSTDKYCGRLEANQQFGIRPFSKHRKGFAR